MRLKIAFTFVVLLMGAFLAWGEPAPSVGRTRVVVVLRREVVDVDAAAREIAATYGGRLQLYAEEGLHGFAVEISDSRRGLLASDPRVQELRPMGEEPSIIPATAPPAPAVKPAAAPTAPPPHPAATALGSNPCSTQIGLPCTTGLYQYDGAGNITNVGNDAFSYDGVSRLTSATLASAGGVGQQYAYDPFGNMTGYQYTQNGVTTAGTTPPQDLTTDATTNHLASAAYDEAGRMTTDPAGIQYKYDASGALVETDPPGAQFFHVYGPGGERIAVLSPAGTTTGQYVARWTLRGSDAKVLRELVENTAQAQPTWTWTRDYIYRDGLLLAEIEMPNNGTTAERVVHYHLDHLGTPRLLTDGNGAEIAAEQYYPFGEEITPPGDERMKFTGHERDFNLGTSAGIKGYTDYMHARSYGPVTARFLSVDTHAASPSRPQSWNRYSYVSNNPGLKIDLDGHDEFIAFWAPTKDSVGHTAIGVQNRDAAGRPTGAVTMRELYPQGDIGKWHLSRPGDYRATVVAESSLLRFQAGQHRPPDALIRITGNAQQDARVTATLNATQHANPDYVAPTPDSNKGAASTCATFCATGVRATGIAVTQTGTVRVVGSELGELAHANGVMTPVSIYNSIVGSLDPRVTILKPLPDDKRSPDITIAH